MALAASDFLAPPTDVLEDAGTSCSSTASAQIPCLPGVPKSVFLVMLGFVCTSFVHTRGTWCAMAAFLFSCGHHGLPLDLASNGYHRYRRHSQGTLLGGDLAVGATGRLLCTLPTHRVTSPTFVDTMRYGLEATSAVISRRGTSLPLLPCLPSYDYQSSFSLSQLLLAQLARGPPVLD